MLKGQTTPITIWLNQHSIHNVMIGAPCDCKVTALCYVFVPFRQVTVNCFSFSFLIFVKSKKIYKKSNTEKDLTLLIWLLSVLVNTIHCANNNYA